MSLSKSLHEKALHEIFFHWGFRGIGTTQAMIDGSASDCIFLVMHIKQRADLFRRGVPLQKIIILSDFIDGKMRGIRKPLIVDHFVLEHLIRNSLDAAFQEGLMKKDHP